MTKLLRFGVVLVGLVGCQGEGEIPLPEAKTVEPEKAAGDPETSVLASGSKAMVYRPDERFAAINMEDGVFNLRVGATVTVLDDPGSEAGPERNVRVSASPDDISALIDEPTKGDGVGTVMRHRLRPTP